MAEPDGAELFVKVRLPGYPARVRSSRPVPLADRATNYRVPLVEVLHLWQRSMVTEQKVVQLSEPPERGGDNAARVEGGRATQRGLIRLTTLRCQQRKINMRDREAGRPAKHTGCVRAG
jgi:hypothetical protein